MTPQERAKRLADAHWGYIGGLLQTHNVDESVAYQIGWHYRKAMEHGYGHGVEDERNGMFATRIEAVMVDSGWDAPHGIWTGTQELFTRGCSTCLDAATCAKTMNTDSRGRCLYHRLRSATSGIVKNTTTASLCHTCQRNKMCVGEYPMTKDGGCEGYVMQPITVPAPDSPRADSCTGCSHVADQCAEYRQPDLPCGDFSAKDTPTAAERPAPHTDPAVKCSDCSNTGCELLGAHVTQDSCTSFKAKEAARVIDLHELPSITLGHTEAEVWQKWQEELAEFLAATPYSMDAIVERWDCLQALQTHRECGGHSPETYATVATDLSNMHKGGLPVVEAKRQMLLKNARRGYYAPEVNAEIIASNGASFTP